MAASADFAAIDRLRREWNDAFVLAADRPELLRFAGRVGRVVTVNCNGKAVVDFADGAWYDIALAHLTKATDDEAKGKYDATANSAQASPTRQG